MEMKQLETFVHVAKTLSFSKTADKMYFSQPTVSAYISSLEKSLGAQLFVRNTKEVTLTKAGQAFLAYAQKILSLREQALHCVNGEDRDLRGDIDIISSTIPAQYLLPRIIASFQKEWPNILFSVDQADSRQVEREMSSFRYDFGMVGVIPDDDRFVHYPVYDDELVLVVPNDATESPEMIREDFAGYIRRIPLILRESGSGTRAEIEAILSKIGIGFGDLKISAYFSDTHSILLAVSCGMGVSLISKVAAALHAKAGLVRMVEMDDPLFHRQIHLLYNKERWLSPVQKKFADHILNFYHSADNRSTD